MTTVMITLLLVAILALPALVFLLVYPRAGMWVWVLVLSTAPDNWLNHYTGGVEATASLLKIFELVMLVAVAWRYGLRLDRWNPSFAFLIIFTLGLAHGLYPGLTLFSSFHSLIGSTTPFLFAFIRQDETFSRTCLRALLWAPLFAVGVSLLLNLLGLSPFYMFNNGAIRLGATQAAFLAGFALVGLYSGLLKTALQPDRESIALIVINYAIILLSGARSPLAVGTFAIIALLFLRGYITVLATMGAMAAFMVLAAPFFSFLRVVDLTQLGDATYLSHRLLVWPYFVQAIQQSPIVGWGLGAGKVVLPLTSRLAEDIGTNAAHNEYLRIGADGGFLGLSLLIGALMLWVVYGSRPLPFTPRWLVRLIFLCFAVQSFTDNTLIASTGSAFFLWASVAFAIARNRFTGAASCSQDAQPLSPSRLALPPSPQPLPAPPPSPLP